jgi:hypothetical protein
MALSSTEIAGLLTDIATLESSRRSSLSTFLGSKPKNGAAWTGTGIVQARKILDYLASNPVNGASNAAYEEAMRRANALCVGA